MSPGGAQFNAHRGPCLQKLWCPLGHQDALGPSVRLQFGRFGPDLLRTLEGGAEPLAPSTGVSAAALLGFHVEQDGLHSTDRPVTSWGRPPQAYLSAETSQRGSRAGPSLSGTGTQRGAVARSWAHSQAQTPPPSDLVSQPPVSHLPPSAGFLGVRRAPAPPSDTLTPAEVAVGGGGRVPALHLSGGERATWQAEGSVRVPARRPQARVHRRVGD